MTDLDAELLKYATPEERTELMRLAGIDDLRSYVAKSKPDFQWYRNCVVLERRLEEVVAGTLKRLIVFMPPRFGKSELVSRQLPGYYLGKYPDRWVGLSSYGAELAETLSDEARQNMIAAGYAVNLRVASKRHWKTVGQGGCWAAGVGGPILGKGAHLAIIDDPIKNEAEAKSETERRTKKDWYKSTLSSRLEPGAALVVMQQRWHADDLAGAILLMEKENLENGEPTEDWHIIDFAALYGHWNGEEWEESRPRKDIPENCTLEPDWRQPGEALCPERFSQKELLKKRAQTSGYYWSAMYQQRPVPQEGVLFKEDWFDIVATKPDRGSRVRFWDRAASVGRGDWTVGTLMCKAPDGNYYVEDVVRGRWTTGTRDRMIRDTAVNDGLGVRQHGEQEPGAAGKDSALQFVKMLTDEGLYARCEPASGDKEVRADPAAGAAELGRVKLVKGHWNELWLEEICSFPFGQHDDQVDTLSGAYNKLVKKHSVAQPIESVTEPSGWTVA